MHTTVFPTLFIFYDLPIRDFSTNRMFIRTSRKIFSHYPPGEFWKFRIHFNTFYSQTNLGLTTMPFASPYTLALSLYTFSRNSSDQDFQSNQPIQHIQCLRSLMWFINDHYLQRFNPLHSLKCAHYLPYFKLFQYLNILSTFSGPITPSIFNAFSAFSVFSVFSVFSGSVVSVPSVVSVVSVSSVFSVFSVFSVVSVYSVVSVSSVVPWL